MSMQRDPLGPAEDRVRLERVEVPQQLVGCGVCPGEADRPAAGELHVQVEVALRVIDGNRPQRRELAPRVALELDLDRAGRAGVAPGVRSGPRAAPQLEAAPARGRR